MPSYGLTCIDNERASRMVVHWYMEREHGGENLGVFLKRNDLTDEFMKDIVQKFEERWAASTKVMLFGTPEVRAGGLTKVRSRGTSEMRGVIEIQFDRLIDSRTLELNFEPGLHDVDRDPIDGSDDGRGWRGVRVVCSGVMTDTTYGLTIRAEAMDGSGIFAGREPVQVAFAPKSLAHNS